MGAWIETSNCGTLLLGHTSRPAWARGLKPDAARQCNCGQKSRPTWARGLKLVFRVGTVILPRRAPRGRVYCPAHALGVQRRYGIHRGNSGRRGYESQWRQAGRDGRLSHQEAAKLSGAAFRASPLSRTLSWLPLEADPRGRMNSLFRFTAVAAPSRSLGDLGSAT